MRSLFLAVDAGGTRTTYVLADGTTVLARAQAGTIKRLRVSAEVAEQHLEEGLMAIEHLSGRSLTEVMRTCVGISGQTVPMVREWAREALETRVGGELVIGGDVDIAFDAAFAAGRGVVVLAGTGSNVLARASDGTVFNVGGWGPMLGDQGSGYWIGRESLMHAFEAMNEGRPSAFLEEVMIAWKAPTLAEVVAHAHTLPPPDLSTLSFLVDALATEGDPDCQDVLMRAGDKLAEQVLAVLRRVHLHEQQQSQRDTWRAPEIACAGSILAHIAPLRAAMSANLSECFPGIKVRPGVVDPVMGALWWARDAGRIA